MPKNMGKKKILIIDDEVNFTKMVKLNLEFTGKYEVRIENKGTQALVAARAFKPDMIFLDIIMPDMDGSETASQIRNDKSTKNIPIVFLSAILRKEEENHSGIINSYPFIAKPVNVKELIECIEKNTRKSKRAVVE